MFKNIYEFIQGLELTLSGENQLEVTRTMKDNGDACLICLVVVITNGALLHTLKMDAGTWMSS